MTSSDTWSGASSLTQEGGTVFPGFGEGAPLELPELSSDAVSGLAQRIADGSWKDFADAAAAARHCSHPVRLIGTVDHIDTATGEVQRVYDSNSTALGVLFKPCGNRREHICPACSRLYARDTFEVIRTGVLGGKDVPVDVARNPLLFVTLTAPSFGHVHTSSPERLCRPRRRDDRTRCPHGRPLWCHRRHDVNDDHRGTPLCEDCYDYASHVVWQWWAPELWRRFTMNVRRQLASCLGCTDQDLNDHASLQFAKVAEYQARGVIHFHALLRLDGPAEHGVGAPAPSAVSTSTLVDLVTDAARSTHFTAPEIDGADRPRRLVFGQQLDVRPVRGHIDDGDHLTAGQVAGYLAKYATKDATNAGGVERRATRHIRRLRTTCTDLHRRAVEAGGDSTPYDRLGKWEHALGFRGHFSTKSRRYSVTLGSLRRRRARFQSLVSEASRSGREIDLAEIEARLLAEDDEETTLVVGSWQFAGIGWPSPGDAELATAAAVRAREYARWKSTN